MRHIKNYNELFEAQMELTPEQIKWLDKCTRGKWTLNKKTGLVDVKGDFICAGQGLTDFKGVRFGAVTKIFNCPHNRLTSLEGAPQKVGWYFICDDNQLTSLEGAPLSVGGSFYCRYNGLTSLEGAPQEVGKSFYCDENSLTSLEGAPLSVGGSFYCRNNQITSLEGAPQKSGGSLFGKDNPVSQRTLVSLYRRMKSGLSWPDAVASYWGEISNKEDKILLASYHPDPSREDVKGYHALGKFRNKII
jgi:hypothetical protein